MDPAEQSKVSLTFYCFEKTLEAMPGFAHLRRRRSLADLQLLAGLVWAREGGRGKCPTVSAIPGHTSHYWYDDRRVTLAPPHRNAAGVLHEMAHALGPRDKLAHGPAFRKRCIRLYREYSEWDGTVSFDKPKGKTK